MTLVAYTSEERNQRLISYATEDGKADLWLMMADFVSVAKEWDKSYEDAEKLLQDIWEGLEVRTTQ